MVVNDNLGLIIAGIFQIPTTASKQINLIEINGITKDIRPIGSSTVALMNHTAGALCRGQVGKGVSIPTRQDENIEVPFTNGGVEDNPQLMGVFGYNSGLGKVNSSVTITPTTGSGTITEVVMTIRLNDNSGNPFDFLITRDLVSPVINFITAQTINLELVFNI